jgi:hypothetical protein
MVSFFSVDAPCSLKSCKHDNFPTRQ